MVAKMAEGATKPTSLDVAPTRAENDVAKVYTLHKEQKVSNFTICEHNLETHLKKARRTAGALAHPSMATTCAPLFENGTNQQVSVWKG